MNTELNVIESVDVWILKYKSNEFSHVANMPEDRIANKVLKYKSRWERNFGRPQKKWMYEDWTVCEKFKKKYLLWGDFCVIKSVHLFKL
jgi:hypothetical protein